VSRPKVIEIYDVLNYLSSLADRSIPVIGALFNPSTLLFRHHILSDWHRLKLLQTPNDSKLLLPDQKLEAIPPLDRYEPRDAFSNQNEIYQEVWPGWGINLW